MSVTSANVHDLQTFVSGAKTARQARSPEYDTCNSLVTTVMAACPPGDGYYVPTNAPSMGAVKDLLDTWDQNETFVREIRKDLLEADDYDGDGTVTIPDSTIKKSLEGAGVSKPPGAYDIPATELQGSPPHSGFVDDPICLANGNLLLPEEDLDLPGLASVLSVVRSYNSRGHEHTGIHGAGWSTIAEVRLVVSGPTAEFILADGGAANFTSRGDGTWTRNHRRRRPSTPSSPAGRSARATTARGASTTGAPSSPSTTAHPASPSSAPRRRSASSRPSRADRSPTPSTPPPVSPPRRPRPTAGSRPIATTRPTAWSPSSVRAATSPTRSTSTATSPPRSTPTASSSSATPTTPTAGSRPRSSPTAGRRPTSTRPTGSPPSPRPTARRPT